MIKHAAAGGFLFCRFPDEWRLGLPHAALMSAILRESVTIRGFVQT
jgi:hypothetical protein